MWKWFPTPGRAVTATLSPSQPTRLGHGLRRRARLGRLSAEQRSVLRETLAKPVRS